MKVSTPLLVASLTFASTALAAPISPNPDEYLLKSPEPRDVEWSSPRMGRNIQKRDTQVAAQGSSNTDTPGLGLFVAIPSFSSPAPQIINTPNTLAAVPSPGSGVLGTVGGLVDSLPIPQPAIGIIDGALATVGGVSGTIAGLPLPANLGPTVGGIVGAPAPNPNGGGGLPAAPAVGHSIALEKKDVLPQQILAQFGLVPITNARGVVEGYLPINSLVGASQQAPSNLPSTSSAGSAVNGAANGLGLGGLTSGLTGTLGGLTGSLGGLTGGLGLGNTLGGLTGSLGGLLGGVGNIAGGVTGTVGGLTGGFTNTVGGLTGGLGGLGGTVGGLTGGLGNTVGGLTGGLGGLGNTVGGLTGSLGGLTGSNSQSPLSNLPVGGNTYNPALGSLTSNLGGAVGGAYGTANGVVSTGRDSAGIPAGLLGALIGEAGTINGFAAKSSSQPSSPPPPSATSTTTWATPTTPSVMVTSTSLPGMFYDGDALDAAPTGTALNVNQDSRSFPTTRTVNSMVSSATPKASSSVAAAASGVTSVLPTTPAVIAPTTTSVVAPSSTTVVSTPAKRWTEEMERRWLEEMVEEYERGWESDDVAGEGEDFWYDADE